MLGENIRLAFVSMAANRLRSFLTMLGIMIGIAAVIAIMTVGNSQTAENQRQYSSFGVNNISVYMWLQDGLEVDEDTDMSSLVPNFTQDMMRKMTERYGDQIRAISAESGGNSGRAVLSDASSSSGEDLYANVYLDGVTPGYFEVNSGTVTMLAGRVFGSREVSADSYVCIASNYLVENLFGGDSDKALGSRIDISVDDTAYTYTIIGVYQSQDYYYDGSVTSTRDITSALYIPFLNCQAMSGDDVYSKSIQGFEIEASPGVDVISFTSELQDYLTSLLPSDTRFQVQAYNNAQWIQESENSMRQQTMTVTMIGAIALLVGGIGVMNIMTVSITERTREIGTRKALGARNGAIRMQFITEAVIISVIGGLIGIIAGIAVGFIICHAVQHIPMTLSLSSILVSFLFSFAVGVFFGFYPADKAAKMDPIEALRYE